MSVRASEKHASRRYKKEMVRRGGEKGGPKGPLKGEGGGYKRRDGIKGERRGWWREADRLVRSPPGGAPRWPLQPSTDPLQKERSSLTSPFVRVRNNAGEKTWWPRPHAKTSEDEKQRCDRAPSEGFGRSDNFRPPTFKLREKIL